MEGAPPPVNPGSFPHSAGVPTFAKCLPNGAAGRSLLPPPNSSRRHCLAGWNLIIPRVNTDPIFTRSHAALPHSAPLTHLCCSRLLDLECFRRGALEALLTHHNGDRSFANPF